MDHIQLMNPDTLAAMERALAAMTEDQREALKQAVEEHAHLQDGPEAQRAVWVSFLQRTGCTEEQAQALAGDIAMWREGLQ